MRPTAEARRRPGRSGSLRSASRRELCALAAALIAAAALPGSVHAGEEPQPAKPATAAAEEAPPLLYLGVNEHGAEEWYRVRDGAVVVRVPRGPYLRRPYEGAAATLEPAPVEVETFFVDKHEVTNERFARFLDSVEDATPLVNPAVPGLVRSTEGRWTATPELARHPVTAATGHGALAFARWAGARLPSRAEWEKAAGGADGRTFPWGEESPDASRANFGRPRPRGAERVGSHVAGASPYGCLDMAGNVYERVLMPGRRQRDGGPLPIVLKGGSWLSPHPLNLRVADMCVQPLEVAEHSVGFRCVMDDPDPERPTRAAGAAERLRLRTDFDAAVAEARKRRVPLFLSLLIDTCGQCDRTRAQCYRDPRFVAYCNANLVVVIGHEPGDAFDEPHPPGAADACPLYPGLTCTQHEELFRRGTEVVGGFVVSPGNFVLHPDRIAPGAGEAALLVRERELPKWGNAVEEYIAAFERARAALAAE